MTPEPPTPVTRGPPEGPPLRRSSLESGRSKHADAPVFKQYPSHSADMKETVDDRLRLREEFETIDNYDEGTDARNFFQKMSGQPSPFQKVVGDLEK
ncbi:hypothetical protein KH5H1_77920 [Corallococcus caeni]|nr:hypothetical protein KH5H1_77920 [Corallococcus sp. KH5-1]